MAVLSTKGQIVIPERIRNELDLKPGVHIAVERLDDSILLMPRQKDAKEALRSLRGCMKGLFDEDAVTLIRKSRDMDNQIDSRETWHR
jgi:AbrB family looped-hinge helix DNA binding protein